MSQLTLVEGYLDGDGLLRHQALCPLWNVVGVSFDDGAIGKTEEDACLMAVNGVAVEIYAVGDDNGH